MSTTPETTTSSVSEAKNLRRRSSDNAETNTSVNPTPNNTAGETHTFNINEFIDVGGTNQAVEGRNRIENLGARPREVTFPPEMHRTFEDFALNHTQRLTKLFGIHPDPNNPTLTLFDQLMDNPEFAHEKDLLILFGEEVKGDDGRVLRWQPSEKKIKAAMNEPETWLMLEREMARMQSLETWAVGLNETARPAGNRQDRARARVHHTGRGQSGVHRFFYDTAIPFLRHPTQTAGRNEQSWGVVGRERWQAWGLNLLAGGGAAGIGARLGALLGPWGAAGGAVTGAGVTALVDRMRAHGLEIRQFVDEDGLNLLHADPALSAFVNVMTDTNPGEFNVVGNHIERVGTPGLTIPDPEKNANESLRMWDARVKFWRQLGVDNLLDATPVQLFQHPSGPHNPRRYEQIPSVFNKRLLDELRKEGFNPNVNNFNYTNQQYMRAEARVISSLAEDLIREKPEFSEVIRVSAFGEIDQAKLSAINKRLGELAENGEEFRKRSKPHEERKIALQKEKEDLEKSGVNQDERKKVVQAREAIEDEIHTEFPALTDISTSGLSTEITRIRNELTDTTPPILPARGPFAYRKDSIGLREEAAITAALAAIPAGVANEERRKANAEARVRQNYDNERQRLRDEEAELKKAVDDLIKFRKRLAEQDKNNKELNDRMLGTANEDLDRLVADYTYAQSILRIPEANLRHMPLDQLNVEMNNLYDSDHRQLQAGPHPTGIMIERGWPAIENGNEDHRRSLINAITEAKARNQEQREAGYHQREASANRDAHRTAPRPIPVPPARLGRLGVLAERLPAAGFPTHGPIDNPIVEADLATLPREDILNVMHRLYDQDRRDAIPTAERRGWPPTQDARRADQLTEAIDYAKNRRSIRHAIHTDEQMKNVDSLMAHEDRLIKAIDDTELRPERERLELQKLAAEHPQMVEGLERGYGDASAQAIRIFTNHEQLARLTNNGILDAAHVPQVEMHYTQPEREFSTANGIPEGYFTMLNILTGYQQDPTQRAERFRQAQQAYPYRTMAVYMNEAFRWRLPNPEALPATNLFAILSFEIDMDRTRRRAIPLGNPVDPRLGRIGKYDMLHAVDHIQTRRLTAVAA